MSNDAGLPFRARQRHRHDLLAERARRHRLRGAAWLSAAKASCSARRTPNRSRHSPRRSCPCGSPGWRRSAPRPASSPQPAPWPMRSPTGPAQQIRRARSSTRCRRPPPAGRSRRAIASAACTTACSPEPQTRLTVSAGTVTGTPALIAACRATFMPAPACSTQPMITSSRAAGATAPRGRPRGRPPRRDRRRTHPSGPAERADRRAACAENHGQRAALDIASDCSHPPRCSTRFSRSARMPDATRFEFGGEIRVAAVAGGRSSAAG